MTNGNKSMPPLCNPQRGCRMLFGIAFYLMCPTNELNTPTTVSDTTDTADSNERKEEEEEEGGGRGGTFPSKNRNTRRTCGGLTFNSSPSFLAKYLSQFHFDSNLVLNTSRRTEFSLDFCIQFHRPASVYNQDGCQVNKVNGLWKSRPKQTRKCISCR